MLTITKIGDVYKAPKSHPNGLTTPEREELMRNNTDELIIEFADVTFCEYNTSDKIKRFHTEPIKWEISSQFNVGDKIQGVINRALYSFPQCESDINRLPVMIDDRPTYFKTWIDSKVKYDEDNRLSNKELFRQFYEREVLVKTTD